MYWSLFSRVTGTLLPLGIRSTAFATPNSRSSHQENSVAEEMDREHARHTFSGDREVQ